MENAITFTIEIDGVDYKPTTPYPIKWSSMLDERLDEGRVSIKHCTRKLFAPLTPVKIVATSRLKTVHKSFVVASDSAVEVPINSDYFNHELMLVEETKLLEGFIVDAITFTNDLGRNYTKAASNLIVNVEEIGETPPAPDADKITTIKESKSPKLLNADYSFISLKKLFSEYASQILGQWIESRMTVYLNGFPEHNFSDKSTLGELPSTLDDNDFNQTLKSGIYDVNYYIKIRSGNNVTVKYSFATASNHDPLPRWNITSVINRVLDVAETHLKGQTPRFKLNPAQAAQFAKIEAPEFAFTKATLKEILDQIGGFIHGIPRLNDGEIFFDMLGGTKRALMDGEGNYFNITNILSQEVESYASGLDSSVDNLVNILDRSQGVITEPYFNAYKSVRTENVYARIEEGNMCIITSFPIQDIISVKFTLPDFADLGVRLDIDIAPYIFELADYQRLSSYEELYPNSKAYALYFTQGEKNIKGLMFKVPSAINGVFKNYAIANIVKKTSGADFTTLPSEEYTMLAFQVNYIPIFNARVQSARQDITDFKYPRTLAFNQGANLVETRYYGENLKGVMARMGNIEMTRTYTLAGFNLVPEIGEIIDEDFYVASVDVEVLPTIVKCTVGLSKDFNRLSQYIGINSNKRYYEVSEKQAYRRDMSYLDYCVIGDETNSDETLIQPQGVEAIKDIFTQAVTGSLPITVSQAQGLMDITGGTLPVSQVSLPVISTAFGNSMVFTFGYEDNYSAGLQSALSSNGNVKGYFTNSVTYGDYYGRMDYLNINLSEKGYSPTTSAEKRAVSLSLPASVQTDPIGAIATAGQPLVVRKNGTEIIAFNYQLAFVTNKKGYIIGSALCRNCSLVRGYYGGHSAKLYVLPERLSKFADVIDLDGAALIADYGAQPSKLSINGKQIKITDEVVGADGAAWAIVDSVSGELLIGCNVVIQSGTTLTMPFMTFKHDIFK